MSELKIGLRHSVTHSVTENDTALHFHSGALPVLATPVLICTAEETCFLACLPYLAEGEGTVGTKVNISHTAPTPVGMKYRCDCVLEKIEGRKLTFSVTLYDEIEEIAHGSHERFIINETRFTDKAYGKSIH